jgi:hypothetical protein
MSSLGVHSRRPRTEQSAHCLLPSLLRPVILPLSPLIQFFNGRAYLSLPLRISPLRPTISDLIQRVCDIERVVLRCPLCYLELSRLPMRSGAYKKALVLPDLDFFASYLPLSSSRRTADSEVSYYLKPLSV